MYESYLHLSPKDIELFFEKDSVIIIFFISALRVTVPVHTCNRLIHRTY